MNEKWVVKHAYTREEYETDCQDYRYGVPLYKFLYAKMRRSLSMWFLDNNIRPISGYDWYCEGTCDIVEKVCYLELWYRPDPEQRWIIKKADIPENKPQEVEESSFDKVWDIVQESFTIEELALLRNRVEQCLKLI